MRNPFFLTMVSVARAVLCWCSAFWIFTTSGNGILRSISLVPFLLAALLCAVCSHFFFRKARTFPAVIGWGAGWSLTLTPILLLWFSNLRSGQTIFFGIVSVLSVVILSVLTSLKPPTPVSSISSMELTVLFFFLFLWYQAVSELAPVYTLPLLCAVLLSLSAVIYQRLSSLDGFHLGKLRGLLLVLALLGAVLLLLTGFLLFGAESMGKGVLVLVGAVKYVLQTLFLLFERFMFWLFSLLGPPKTVSGALEAPAAAPVLDTLDENALSPFFIMVLGSLTIVGILGLLVCLMLRLRHFRIGGKTISVSAGQVTRQRLSLSQWLQRLKAALSHQFRLFLLRLSAAGTPQALYYTLTCSARAVGLGIQPGETPCSFLYRLAEHPAAAPELSQALEQLAEILQTALYSPDPVAPLPTEAARTVQRSFRQFCRQQRAEQLRSKAKKREKDAASDKNS